MGILYSKKENKGEIQLRIISPFLCIYEIKENYHYNREEYYKFIPKNKINILKNDSCKIALNFRGKIIEDNITLDLTQYTEKLDIKGSFYELEKHYEDFTLFFRIKSKNLNLKECVMKIS